MTSHVVLYLPVCVITAYFLLFLLPPTRQVALWSLEENHPIEIITFISLFLAAICGLKLTVQLIKRQQPRSLIGFYSLFSIGLLIVAFEEIAWGQLLIGFKTPEFWQQINVQGETTLHNISGLQGHSEVFRLIYGVGAIVGLLLSGKSQYQKISCPQILIFWVMIIVTHALLDVFNDYVPIQKRFDAYMQRTSELIEMMIGLCSLLYIFLNSKLLLSNDMK